MAKEKFEGRYASSYDQDFVLYVFGLKVNRWRNVRDWWGIVKYAHKMRMYLQDNRDEGMLHAEPGFVHGTPCIISYWRSFEDLERFARDKQKLHMSGWRWYNKEVHRNSSVGMWHEMYRVPAGHVGGLYNDLPRIGMAAIGEHKPVGSTLKTAAQRLGLKDEDDFQDHEWVGTHHEDYAVQEAKAAAMQTRRNGSTPREEVRS